MRLEAEPGQRAGVDRRVDGVALVVGQLAVDDLVERRLAQLREQVAALAGVEVEDRREGVRLVDALAGVDLVRVGNQRVAVGGGREHDAIAVDDVAPHGRLGDGLLELAHGVLLQLRAAGDLPVPHPEHGGGAEHGKEDQEQDDSKTAICSAEHVGLLRWHADPVTEPGQPMLLCPLDDLRLGSPLRSFAQLGLQLLLQCAALDHQVVDLVVRHAGLERLREVDESEQERHEDRGEHHRHGTDVGAPADGNPATRRCVTGRAPKGSGGVR